LGAEINAEAQRADRRGGVAASEPRVSGVRSSGAASRPSA
jgi:hypothetical protein